MDRKSIKGKVAIVTGAAKGIGEAIAIRYGEEGAKVVVVDINGEGATAVSQAITQNGGTAIPVKTDVSQEDEVNALIQKTVDTYGTVDILVNNAGVVSPTKHFLEADKA
ncbi:MAG: SDR family NAD(P)-dependent oxidoreductase, partial [Chloroflexota bacterium]